MVVADSHIDRHIGSHIDSQMDNLCHGALGHTRVVEFEKPRKRP